MNTCKLNEHQAASRRQHHSTRLGDSTAHDAVGGKKALRIDDAYSTPSFFPCLPGADRHIRDSARGGARDCRSTPPPPKRTRARARGSAERECVGVTQGVPLTKGEKPLRIARKSGVDQIFFPRWWRLYVAGTYFKPLIELQAV